MSAFIMQAARRYISTTTARASQHASPETIKKGSKLWQNITMFVAVPAVVLCSISNYFDHKEHMAHFVRPPFVKYDYLAIRTRKYPWGDGNHGLFHNPRFNALPDGYEDEQ